MSVAARSFVRPETKELTLPEIDALVAEKVMGWHISLAALAAVTGERYSVKEE